VALTDDGDLIRGVGFVAIYAAYVEEGIDELLEALSFVEPVDDSLRKAQSSRKLKAIRQRLLKLQAPEFQPLIDYLGVCGDLLEARHEIIHGRIYAQARGPDVLEPGRPGRQKRPVTSIELYDLANQLATCRGVLRRPMIFAIPKARARWSAT
jgi:hypothetical protein